MSAARPALHACYRLAVILLVAQHGPDPLAPSDWPARSPPTSSVCVPACGLARSSFPHASKAHCRIHDRHGAGDQQTSDVLLTPSWKPCRACPCHLSSVAWERGQSRQRSPVLVGNWPCPEAKASMAVAVISPDAGHGLQPPRRFRGFGFMLEPCLQSRNASVQYFDLFEINAPHGADEAGKVLALIIDDGGQFLDPRFALRGRSHRVRPDDPAVRLINWVRWRTNNCRVRNTMARACCSELLISTKRMVGRDAASAIAFRHQLRHFSAF